MSARTPLLTPKPIACALGLLLSCLASQSQAQVWNYLTDPSQRAFDISDLTVSSSGVGITTLSSQIDTYYGHSVTTQSPVFMGTVRSYSEVVLKPTATSTGLAYDYNVNRYIGRETSASWNTSNATINVTSDATQSAGDKYILVTGKLTAIDDLNVGYISTVGNEISLGYYASSNGNFQTNNSIVPGVSGIQGSASFYFGANAGLELPALISASSSTTYNAIDKTYVATTNPITNSAVTNGFLLKGGETTSFSALVYASDGASLKDFSIKLNSSTFNFGWGEYDVGQSYTRSDYVGQHILATVPEPETYAMLLAGLGLVGAVTRRNKAKAKALIN